MKISVKLLKGDLFHVEAEKSDTVESLKQKIQEQRNDLPADRQKLIHSGKVLKDTQSVEEIGLSESEFIVCMVTKEVAKPKASPSISPAVTTPVSASPAPPAASSGPAATAAPAAAAAPALAPAVPTAPAAPAVTQSFVTPEALAALTGMGFPENESRAALQAAMGNPDLAYEFLLTGIPPQAARRSQMFSGSGAPATSAAAAVASAAAAAPAQTGIQQLRSHPQFNMLKQLIQSNPAALPQVLELIGQQSPALLEAINANEQQFLEMMNEPITENAPVAPAAAAAPSAAAGAGGQTAQLLQLMSMLPPEQRAQMAQQMGLTPDQLNAFMQMMASMPPEQLNQILSQSGGLGAPAAGPPPGAIMLTHEEMESVNRLAALGFSQQQAAQAFIACDRNENLAANFLFENGWGDEDDFGGAGDDHDHDDNMYN